MADPAANLDEQPRADDSGAASAHLPTGSQSRAWRAADRLVVAGFVLGLLAPAVLLAAGLRPRSVENRPLRAVPALTVNGLLDASWAVGVDGFLADNVLLRPYAIRARGEAYWLAGGTGTPEAIRGRNGWLFIRGEFQPNCLFTGDQLGAALAGAATAFSASGQDFRFLLIPDKHSVYPDLLRPDSPFGPSCADHGRAALAAVIDGLRPLAIDASPLLATARDVPGSAGLYYTKDSHWTPSGAIVAIRALIESLDAGAWDAEDVVRDGTRRRVTDIAALMGIQRVETTPQLVVRPGGTLQIDDVSVPVEVNNARAIFRVTASGDRPTLPGRTVIVYDSFFGIYVPLVAPFFADSTWIHVGDLVNHPELASILGPFDRIVFERVERGLYGTDVGALLSPLVRPAPN